MKIEVESIGGLYRMTHDAEKNKFQFYAKNVDAFGVVYYNYIGIYDEEYPYAIGGILSKLLFDRNNSNPLKINTDGSIDTNFNPASPKEE